MVCPPAQTAARRAMLHLFAPQSPSERPAMRGLVLAWAAVAAQTPFAGWAWLGCFGFGLLLAARAGRWPAPHDLPNRPLPSALHELSPGNGVAASPALPARRRGDVARAAAATPTPLLSAHRDLVTGLATLQHLHDDAVAWSGELQSRGQAASVLQMSLHGLADITDRYGHEAGNQMRVQVARRLRHLTRESDRLVRLDGDRYALLLAGPGDEAAEVARSLAARIVQEVQRPLSFLTLSNLHLGCCVGSTVWLAASEPIDAALQRSASALELAERSGPGHTRQYAALREAAVA